MAKLVLFSTACSCLSIDILLRFLSRSSKDLRPCQSHIPPSLCSFLLYDDGDATSANYDYSSFDFERTPVSSGSQSNSPSTFGVDTSAFDYDYEDDYVKELVVQPQTTAQTQHARNKVRVLKSGKYSRNIDLDNL